MADDVRAGSLATVPVPHRMRPRLGVAGTIALLAISFGVVTALAVSAFLYHATLDFLVERQQQDQAANLRYAGSRIVAQIEAARRDARFVLQTPAMQGFIRADTNGEADPVDDSSLTLTNRRAGELFRALLLARPAYLSIRFLDANGYETIVARRAADGSVAVLPPDDLQSHARDPYFAEAAKLSEGATWVSDPGLRREQGKVVVPHAAVAPVSAPVRNAAGTFLGVVSVDIDAERMLALAGDVFDHGTRVYVATSRGDYLANPDAARTYGFDLGRPARIQADFPALAPLVDGTAATLAERERSSTGLLTAAIMPFDPLHPERHLILAAEQTVSVPFAQIAATGVTIAGVAGLVILMGAVMALVLLRFVVAPLRRIRTAAVSLTAGRRDIAIGPLAGRNDELGDLAQSIGVMAAAIAEREDRLTAQAAELKRSNQDLAQFAYVASHDLQEPLRMVGSYLELLSRRYKGRLDQEADEFIGFAVDGAARMKRLINDLLGYSRAGNTPLKWQRTGLDDVLKRVLLSVDAHLKEVGGTIEVAPLPLATCDAAQMERVFQNLIDNALKYRSAAPPQVRVSAIATDRGWEFAVADNGIGIDPRFRDQIFEIFKRLHGRDQYSGTGIGLAVAKLAVERHGGKIWVEPGENGGSVFRFTLPEPGMME